MEIVEKGVDQRTQAFVTGGAYGALVLAGLVFGLVESFIYSLGVGAVPVTAVVLCLLNFGGIVLAGRGMGTVLGAAVPAIAWWVTLVVFSVARPEGDLIISTTLAGYLYMLGGTTAALAGIIVTPSRGSWLLAGSDPRIG